MIVYQSLKYNGNSILQNPKPYVIEHYDEQDDHDHDHPGPEERTRVNDRP